MLVRAARWIFIGAPLLGGVGLILFGTAGGISVAFGVTLISISVMVWMWNWFVRMSFAETTREKEAVAREQRVAPVSAQPIAPPPGARPGDPPTRQHPSQRTSAGDPPTRQHPPHRTPDRLRRPPRRRRPS